MSRSNRWRGGAWALLVTGVGIFVLAVALVSPLGWRRAARPARPAAGDEATQALAWGRTCLQKGKPGLAIKAVAAIGPGTPHEAEALTIRGLALAALADVGPARLLLERAWDLRPNAMAAKVLAAIYLAANETDRGLQMLRAAARLDPDDFRPWFAMGESVFLARRSYDQAATAFRAALKRRPDHWESRVGLSAALTRAHHLDQAEPLLQALLRERPDHPSLLFLAAAVAVESGRHQEAARYLERVLALDPDHREALLLRARAQLRDHQPREALADAERACVLAPNDLEALHLVGSIQIALGLKDQAAETVIRRQEVERRKALIEEITLQIQRTPADPEPRWRLGDAAALAGMRPLAAQSYQAALALAPDCKQARHGLRQLELASPGEASDDQPSARRPGRVR